MPSAQTTYAQNVHECKQFSDKRKFPFLAPSPQAKCMNHLKKSGTSDNRTEVGIKRQDTRAEAYKHGIDPDKSKWTAIAGMTQSVAQATMALAAPGASGAKGILDGGGIASLVGGGGSNNGGGSNWLMWLAAAIAAFFILKK